MALLPNYATSSEDGSTSFSDQTSSTKWATEHHVRMLLVTQFSGSKVQSAASVLDRVTADEEVIARA
jgi:hypothetical protein